jgi:hypothetical protein
MATLRKKVIFEKYVESSRIYESISHIWCKKKVTRIALLKSDL